MTLPITRITHPDDPLLDTLCDRLSELAPSLEAEDAWPAHQLEECGRYGVFEWFVELLLRKNRQEKEMRLMEMTMKWWNQKIK